MDAGRSLAGYFKAVDMGGWRHDGKCFLRTRDGALELTRPMSPPPRWSRLLGGSWLYGQLWGKDGVREEQLASQRRGRENFYNALEKNYGTLLAGRAIRLAQNDSVITVRDVRSVLRFAREASQEANARLIAQCVAQDTRAQVLGISDLETRVTQELGDALWQRALTPALVADAIHTVLVRAGSHPVDQYKGRARAAGITDEAIFERALADCVGIANAEGQHASEHLRTKLQTIIRSAGLSTPRAAEVLRFAASSHPAYREHIVRDLCTSQRTVFNDQGVVRSAAVRRLIPASYSPAQVRESVENDIRARMSAAVSPGRFDLDPTARRDCNRNRLFVEGERMPSDPESFGEAFRAKFGKGSQADMLATLASRFMCQTNAVRLAGALAKATLMPAMADAETIHEACRNRDGSWTLSTTYRNHIQGVLIGTRETRGLTNPACLLCTITCTLTPGSDDQMPSVSDIRTEALYTSDRAQATGS